MGLSASSFDYLRNFLRERAAIVLEPDKAYLAKARLGDLARQQGLANLDELCGRLRATPEGGLHRRVLEAMTTNETSFFRDGHPFAALRSDILPELVRRRAAERSLTIWSAACSTGQEPYSLALLIRETFPHLLGWGLRLLATDLNTEVLDRARRGEYTAAEVARGLPPDLLGKYFRPVGSPEGPGGQWVIHDEVRRMIEWRPLNLAAPWPALPPVDLLFLRNVLIYLDQSMRKVILARARAVLRPGGYLFLGGPETTLTVDEAFEVVQVGQTVCYRVATAPGLTAAAAPSAGALDRQTPSRAAPSR